MDEPLSNLDAELRHQMRKEIRRLHDTFGTTTIYVTHDQIEAMTLADRIAILDKGVLQQHCEPLEAYNNPANDFVRSFLCKHIDDLVDTANALFNKPTSNEEE
jgi:multiple sugar transport system ATP-binding protein